MKLGFAHPDCVVESRWVGISREGGGMLDNSVCIKLVNQARPFLTQWLIDSIDYPMYVDLLYCTSAYYWLYCIKMIHHCGVSMSEQQTADLSCQIAHQTLYTVHISAHY